MAQDDAVRARLNRGDPRLAEMGWRIAQQSH